MSGRDENKVKSEIGEIYMLSHPTRNSIARNIMKHGNKGCYPSKLSVELEQSRELISFHLLKMENAGLIEGEYGLKNPGKDMPRVVKYYKLTKRGKSAYEKLRKIL